MAARFLIAMAFLTLAAGINQAKETGTVIRRGEGAATATIDSQGHVQQEEQEDPGTETDTFDQRPAFAGCANKAGGEHCECPSDDRVMLQGECKDSPKDEDGEDIEGTYCVPTSGDCAEEVPDDSEPDDATGVALIDAKKGPEDEDDCVGCPVKLTGERRLAAKESIDKCVDVWLTKCGLVADNAKYEHVEENEYLEIIAGEKFHLNIKVGGHEDTFDCDYLISNGMKTPVLPDVTGHECPPQHGTAASKKWEQYEAGGAAKGGR